MSTVLFQGLGVAPLVDFDPELPLASDETLIELLSSAPPKQRIWAAAELALRGRREGVPTLALGVEGPMAYASLEGLRWICPQLGGDPQEMGEEGAPELNDSMGAIESLAQGVMRRVLPDRFIRAQAAALLLKCAKQRQRSSGQQGSPRANASADEAECYLLERLNNRKKDEDRGLCVELVGQLQMEPAVEALLEMAGLSAPSGPSAGKKGGVDRYAGAALVALAGLRPATVLNEVVARFEAELSPPGEITLGRDDRLSDAFQALGALAALPESREAHARIGDRARTQLASLAASTGPLAELAASLQQALRKEGPADVS